MSFQDHYTINIAVLDKDGRYSHLFRTGDSLVTHTEAERVWKLLKEKFPMPQYSLTMTFWECTGRVVNLHAPDDAKVEQSRPSAKFIVCNVLGWDMNKTTTATIQSVVNALRKAMHDGTRDATEIELCRQLDRHGYLFPSVSA